MTHPPSPEIFSWARQIRLNATEMVNTAGLVQWAMLGYRTERHRDGPVGPFIALLADGYRLGSVLAERVLRGEIMTHFEGDAVVLMLDAENARLFDSLDPPAPDRRAAGPLASSPPVSQS